MSTKQHRRSRAKKILSNFMAVAMLAGAAVIGVGAGSVGLASATLAGSTFFDGSDGLRSATEIAHTIQVDDKTDATGDTTFFGVGAKEDDTCPAASNSAPNKGDVNHVFVGSETTASAIFLYLGWDRLDTNGTVTVDFELNQKTTGPAGCSNPLVRERTVGDLLFTFDFQGTAPFDNSDINNISYRVWDGSKWGAENDLTTNMEASINPDGTFGEMVVNMTALGLFPVDACRNFASAYGKTRASSSSFSNELKDLTDPNLAPIDITNCRRVVPKKVDDKGNPLAGASFSLFKEVAPAEPAASAPGAEDTLFGSCGPTTATGTCAIVDVKAGSYWLVETTTPAGYTTALPQLVSVPTGAGADVTATFVDNPVPGTINVHKTKSSGGATSPLAGASFTLLADNAPTGGAVGAEDTATAFGCGPTNASGNCTINNVPLGQYWLAETTTPAGVATAAPQHVVVGLGSAPNQGQTQTFNFDDPVVNGTIHIHKTDANTGQALSGASFALLQDNAPTAPGQAAPGAEDTSTGLGCGPTDGSGNCTISNVPLGKYWAVETVTPNGYDTAAAQAVTIGLGGAANTGDTKTLNFADPEHPGTINVHKSDKNTGDPLAGAVFTLVTDNAPKGGAPGNEDTAGPTCTTNASGNCSFSSVALGDYWVVETTTPAGYATSDPQQAHIGLGAAPGQGVTVSLSFPNPEVPGTVNIHKTDGTTGAGLGNAVFTLFADKAPVGGTKGAEDTTTGLTCTTNASGDCSIGNVPLGDYWVVETTTPTGYATAADQAVTIHLGDSANTGETVNVNFVDQRLAVGVSLVKSVNGNSSTTAANPLVVEKGSTLDYKVVITNTGQVALTIQSLADTLQANLPASCTQGTGTSLAPGASMTCTYSSTAAVPSDGGLVVNKASVAATDQFGRNAAADDTRHVQVLDPAINVVKAGPNGAHVGEKATYTLTVTNPGNIALNTVDASDPKCDAAPTLVSKTGGNQDNVLDPKETWTFTCDHTVVAGDGAEIDNTATVTAVDPLLTKVTSKSSHTVPVLHPAIALIKNADRASANPGQTVTYTYTVSNPGDTPLSTIVVTDDKCSPVTFVGGDTNGDAKLDVNETWTFTCANQASATAGDNTNTGTATGIDRLGAKVQATAQATITVVLAEVIARQLPFTGTMALRLLTIAALLMLAGLFFYLGGLRLPKRAER